MKIIKCIKKVVAMTMLGAVVVSTPVMAKTNDANINSSIAVEDIQDLLSCQVYGYEIDSLYKDRGIRAYAKSYIEEGFVVLDESRLVDNLNTGLVYDEEVFFYEGIKAIDSYDNQTKEIYVCKCYRNVFDNFVKKLPAGFKKLSNDTYECRWDNGDYTSVVFDPNNDLIIYSYYENVN